MVSAGVCFGGKGRLHFVDEKAKVDAAHYVEDCNQLLRCRLGLPFSKTHTAHTAQDWLQANCLVFIAKTSGLQIRQT